MIALQCVGWRLATNALAASPTDQEVVARKPGTLGNPGSALDAPIMGTPAQYSQRRMTLVKAELEGTSRSLISPYGLISTTFTSKWRVFPANG